METFYYDFGTIVFSSYGVDMISIDKPGYTGPRDIKLGDTVDSVLKNFPGKVSEKAYETFEGDLFFFYGGFGEYGSPETLSNGYVRKDEHGRINYIRCYNKPHILAISIDDDRVTRVLLAADIF